MKINEEVLQKLTRTIFRAGLVLKVGKHIFCLWPVFAFFSFFLTHWSHKLNKSEQTETNVVVTTNTVKSARPFVTRQSVTSPSHASQFLLQTSGLIHMLKNATYLLKVLASIPGKCDLHHPLERSRRITINKGHCPKPSQTITIGKVCRAVRAGVGM